MNLTNNIKIEKLFSVTDLKVGDIFRLGYRRDDLFVKAEVTGIKNDCHLVEFSVINGAWDGELSIDPEDGGLTLTVYYSGDEFPGVYIGPKGDDQ